MACFRPVTAFKPSEGPLVFVEKRDCRQIQIKCGQCLGCRLERREGWAIRCLLESKCHQANSFLTLTYDDANYPLYGSLNYRHFQLFLKRLRRKVGPVRFFMCGEYGDEFARPHYHCLLFGVDFADKQRCNSVRSRDPVYRSAQLEELWPYGFSTIGEVSYASARYTAAYCVKRVTGPAAVDHYLRVDTATGELVSLRPEFSQMSRRPGIGALWLERYWRDLYLSGHHAVIVDGAKKRVPRYFDQRMDDLVPLLMDQVEYERYLRSLPFAGDCTPERLAVREEVEAARMAFDNLRRDNKCDTRLLP